MAIKTVRSWVDDDHLLLPSRSLTNFTPENRRPKPKRMVFQTLFFRGELLNFGRGVDIRFNIYDTCEFIWITWLIWFLSSAKQVSFAQIILGIGGHYLGIETYLILAECMHIYIYLYTCAYLFILWMGCIECLYIQFITDIDDKHVLFTFNMCKHGPPIVVVKNFTKHTTNLNFLPFHPCTTIHKLPHCWHIRNN